MDQTLLDVVNSLALGSPSLPATLTIRTLLHFISLAVSLKNDISQAQNIKVSRDAAPEYLSRTIIDFLSESLLITPGDVAICWSSLKDVIWDRSEHEEKRKEEQMFQKAGWEKSLACHTLFPPNTHCTWQECDPSKPLTEVERRQVVLFTLRDGPVPAYSIHRKCRGCNSNYHHDYVVNGGMRYYYRGPSSSLQVGEHQFVETAVLKAFTNLMLFSWTSATNCARWYNETFGAMPAPKPRQSDWACAFKLDTEQAWDGFVLLALVEDGDRRHRDLVLPHTGQQEDRFTEAMRLRNAEIVREGQSELPHSCSACTKVIDKPDGLYYVDAAVTDGVTLGHPCCHVQDCQTELASNRDQFCPLHSGLNAICRIVGCSKPIRHGFKTCASPEHAFREVKLTEKGKAMFQLKARLDRAQVSHTNDAMASSLDPEASTEAATEAEEGMSDETLDLMSFQEICDEKSPQGNTRITARFGRRRTHNEQLIIRPCGVILARATFFGSEAITSVKEMIIGTFHQIGLPCYIFYDNNCSLLKHLISSGDQRLSSVGLPVDVFHFKSKHSEKDEVCQLQCNPALFKELTDDGKWVFNSSIAEQTNVWFGGYHAIVREMKPVKYRFFLDEMISKRNEFIVRKLAKEGKDPHHRPVLFK